MADDNHNDSFSDFFGPEVKEWIKSNTTQDGSITINLRLGLEEAAAGKLETVQYSRQERCQGCGGTGKSWRNDDGTCTNCNSKGFIERQKTKEVSIPPGVETGARLRISGEGNMNPKDLGYGDLHIVVEIAEHKLFERRGKNLYSEAEVQQKQLQEGTEIIVPTLLDGRKQMRIPSGTINGSVFRLAGLGVRSIDSGERGDLFVKVTTPVSNADNRARAKSVVSESPLKPSYTNFSNILEDLFGHLPPFISRIINYSPKNRKTAIIRAVFALVSSVVIISALYNTYFNKRTLESPNQNSYTQPTPKSSVSPIAIPSSTSTPKRDPFSLPNGSEIIPIQGPRGNRYLKIINGGDSDIAVKVVSSSTGKTRRFVYVRANKTVVFKNIALESYVLRIMSGSDWDKDTRKFLSNRSFYEFDKPFDFRKTNHSVSLTPTLGGTLRDIPLSEEDFEDK